MTLGQEQIIIDGELTNEIARHKGRYHFVAFFCRPGMAVLDFPCGTGYGSKIIRSQGAYYFGHDISETAIDYAKRNFAGTFHQADLTTWGSVENYFDLIACIEGLEHIDKRSQKKLIPEFYKALKPGGKLIISTPESTTGCSGPNPKNPFHKYELTYRDFTLLLDTLADWQHVQSLEQDEVLDDGLEHSCFYAVCQK